MLQTRTKQMGLLVLVLSFMAVALPLFAAGNVVEVKGHLIDIACWKEGSGDTAKMLKEHSKDCLLMDECVKSGYAIVTPAGKVYKLDAASNTKAAAWIKSTDHKTDWTVNAQGSVTGNTLTLSSIVLEK